MRKTLATQIDGIAYDITQLDAMTGLDVMAILARVLGPAASSEDPGTALAKSLTGPDLRAVCDAFAKVTMVQGPGGAMSRVPLQGVMSEHFAGQYGSMLKWLKECVMLNYETFFVELGGILAVTTPAAPAPAPNPLMSPVGLVGGSSLRVSGP